jgi:hypothetical protein
VVPEREATVGKFTGPWVEAIHYVARNKFVTLPVLAKYMASDDPAALEQGYDYHVARHLRRVPYPSLEAVKTVLDSLAESEPKAKDARSEQFVNDRFVRELDEAGVF